ncbi:hypothetical protein [Paraglaciecola aestuariivivens]
MANSSSKTSTIPINVRVMIALVASPTLLVVGMLIYTLVFDGWQKVSISMLVFSGLAGLAYYAVFTGRPPRLWVKKSN